jgi:hypothetical protein
MSLLMGNRLTLDGMPIRPRPHVPPPSHNKKMVGGAFDDHDDLRDIVFQVPGAV